MVWQIGVDVGGTFTDLLALDPERSVFRVAKVLSTAEDQSIGFIAGLDELETDLAAVAALVHGTTVATNAVLERKGARCGLITTAGFRDVLELGRRTRPNPYGMIGSFEALIARDLRTEVPERIAAAGRVLTPLDETAVRREVHRLRERGAEALVIHFIHAYANPAHEQRCAEIAREIWPNRFVTLGSDILREVREFEREARQSYAANLSLTVTNAISTLAVNGVMTLGIAVVLYVATLHILDGRLTVGNLYLFIAYVNMLYQPLEQLSYTAWALEGAAAGMQRVFEILDAEDAVPEKASAKPIARVRGEITFENVAFAYETEHPILHSINLSIQPGQTVALVGGTGAGKTTLLSLVPRFYDPNSGRVLIDGSDVRDATKKSLRANISVVLQDTLLLSGTVLENIAYGRPGATRAEIQAAAEAAQANEFIAKLPLGYETQVGERGVRLSGGQKQRIGLARAFLKNAPILLLDEPTSALDLETEAEIMETLRALMRQFTTLIVAHRLSPIHQAHCIHGLENWQVI